MSPQERLERKMIHFYSPYSKTGLNFDEYMTFEEPSNENVENHTDDITKINWEPISNLILMKKRKLFNRTLRMINRNYIKNSQKLLSMYPQKRDLLEK